MPRLVIVTNDNLLDAALLSPVLTILLLVGAVYGAVRLLYDLATALGMPPIKWRNDRDWTIYPPRE